LGDESALPFCKPNIQPSISIIPTGTIVACGYIEFLEEGVRAEAVDKLKLPKKKKSSAIAEDEEVVGNQSASLNKTVISRSRKYRNAL